jgi:DNA-binding protein H-NS
MGERGSEKITDWLEIDLSKLSGQERTNLILEIMELLNAQELRVIRDSAEKQRLGKLKDAKTSVIAEMRQKFGELDLTLEEVLELEGNKKTRKAASPKAKYRSPDGQEWSGRGRIVAWLKKLEDEGHSRAEYKVEAEH